MTLDDIKNSPDNIQILAIGQQYIMEHYQWIDDMGALIQWRKCDYGNGTEYSAKVTYGYNWTYPHTSTLKEAVIMAIEWFDNEREKCRKFLDDIDSDFD